MAENENPPAPSLDDLKKVFREATLEGMKDYDRERSEWEAAEAEQKAKAESEGGDSKPPAKPGGLGAWLLGGSKAS